METFEYTVKDPVGLHARPAGLLAKTCKNFADAKITIEKGGKSAECVRLMSVMGLGIKCGDTVKFTVEGKNESDVAAALKAYCSENL